MCESGHDRWLVRVALISHSFTPYLAPLRIRVLVAAADPLPSTRPCRSFFSFWDHERQGVAIPQYNPSFHGTIFACVMR